MSDNPIADDLRREYPMLWDDCVAFDFAERLGGCTDARLAEANGALHELWLARSNGTHPGTSVPADSDDQQNDGSKPEDEQNQTPWWEEGEWK